MRQFCADMRPCRNYVTYQLSFMLNYKFIHSLDLCNMPVQKNSERELGYTIRNRKKQRKIILQRKLKLEKKRQKERR